MKTGKHVPGISVLTATWNRAHLLTRCYESLRAQSMLPLEWIVVDDGSTDSTTQVLHDILKSAPFHVRSFSQSNQGKHRSINVAARAASGELALILDSDDMLARDALAVVEAAWDSIPDADRVKYAGLAGHSADHYGRLIGKPFPANSDRLSSLRLFHSAAVKGDKLLVHRTELLRSFPFPEFSGEKFVSEGIVWDRIRKSHCYKLLPDVLQVVEYQRDGLSASSLASRVNNPVGACAYYRQLASLDIDWIARVRSIVNYLRFARHSGVRPLQILSAGPAPALCALLMPVGALAARIDRMRLDLRSSTSGSQ